MSFAIGLKALLVKCKIDVKVNMLKAMCEYIMKLG